jgi:hypothetical protein
MADPVILFSNGDVVERAYVDDKGQLCLERLRRAPGEWAPTQTSAPPTVMKLDHVFTLSEAGSEALRFMLGRRA